ncbi:MAG TPA: M67 family metallopeptidase [Phycisphaerae bacterium]|nr:M67 family metallopeptidase [Phycisphaerae bacterium]
MQPVPPSHARRTAASADPPAESDAPLHSPGEASDPPGASTRPPSEPLEIVIGRALLETIERQATRTAPEECCGVLLGRRERRRSIVDRVCPSPNVFDGDRTRRYTVDPRIAFEAFRDSRDSGRCVVGFYHSHTDGSTGPSRADTRAAWPDLFYLIVTLTDGRVTARKAWRMPQGTDSFREEILTCTDGCVTV